MCERDKLTNPRAERETGTNLFKELTKLKKYVDQDLDQDQDSKLDIVWDGWVCLFEGVGGVY